MWKALIGSLLLAGLSACAQKPDLQLNPAEWNFGSIPSYLVAKKEIEIRNRGARPVSLRLLSTCDCLYVLRAPTELKAGQTAPIELAYDPQDQSGFVEAALIVVARRRRAESRSAIRVYGKVLPAGGKPAQ